MTIPQKREDLLDMGYVFDNDAHCRGCGAEIEWWITPKGKKMPMSVQPVKKDEGTFSPVVEYIRVPHRADCPEAASFRKRSSGQG